MKFLSKLCNLVEYIFFTFNFFNGKYVVENVIPYYEPLIAANKRGRHLYWTNFNLPNNISERKTYKASSSTRNNRSDKKFSAPEEGHQDNYVKEPFMNAEKDPAYRKPFGTYKSTKRGKGGSKTPFNKTARKAPARASK